MQGKSSIFYNEPKPSSNRNRVNLRQLLNNMGPLAQGLIIIVPAYCSKSLGRLTVVARHHSEAEPAQMKRDGTAVLGIPYKSGQGINLGHRFEHLAFIIDLVKDKSRVGVCPILVIHSQQGTTLKALRDLKRFSMSLSE